MSAMTSRSFPAGFPGRMKKFLLGGCLGLALYLPALATVPLYDNEAIVTYPGTVSYPPVIDATNFLNNGQFILNFTTLSSPPFYETWNTLNYTNTGNGVMMADTGFQFDDQTTAGPRYMANSFYNSGSIYCASINDTNVAFFFGAFGSGAGQLLVTATNIANPGYADVGLGGLMQFTGRNIDLSRSTLNVEGFGLFENVGIFGLFSQKGVNTNGWNPSADLTAVSAAPSLPISALAATPFGFGFPSVPMATTPYVDVEFPNTNLTVYRYVFVNNPNPSDIVNNVYFGSQFFGSGFATVEWIGSYIDWSTGDTLNNYVYLNDDYLEGDTTNVVLNNGVLDNFTIFESPVQLALGQSSLPGFIPPANNLSGVVTNSYAYSDVQLVATTVPTNSLVGNQNVTNLPNRIQINGTRDLNLTYAQITGPNYMSLSATNQFDGSGGAYIAAPYADINLAVTNGFLTASNVLVATLPNWNGLIQAWSARYLVLQTNVIITPTVTNTYTLTNDVRILIVSSQVSPTIPSQVQNLALRGTNSVVISDRFNVMSTLSVNAQSLTLTTNLIGNGATSPDGELNLNSVNIFWASAMPKLLNLTNYGAIRTMNLANFGSSTQPYNAFINLGLLSNAGGTAIWATNFTSDGNISSGVNNFALQSTTTTLTNGSITAGGNISIATGSLITSNLMLTAGQSLTLGASTLLTDTGVTNGNFWSVGRPSGTGGNGLSLTNTPLAGDLRGTTITNYAPGPNKLVYNVWAGQDFGISSAGYTNNAAIGHLILDAFAGLSGQQGAFRFNGIGTNGASALYVDRIDLLDAATNTTTTGDFKAFDFTTNSSSPNLVIYYAQAVMDGVSVASKMNHKNGDHLRWVPQYAGYFSSTNIIFPDGTTNNVNAALAQNSQFDSNGNGLANNGDPAPFFVSSQIHFSAPLTNRPPPSAWLQWTTCPNATNYVFFTTNISSSVWFPLTNFDFYYYGTNMAFANASHLNWFISPQPDRSSYTNVWLYDPATNGLRYYRVAVQASLLHQY